MSGQPAASTAGPAASAAGRVEPDAIGTASSAPAAAVALPLPFCRIRREAYTGQD